MPLDQVEDTKMSFLQHLEELRKRLVRIVLVVIVMTIAAFTQMDKIFTYILIAPAKVDFWTYRMLCKISEATCIDKIEFSLQSRTLTGQFTMHLTAAFVVGMIAASPYIFYQLWRFIIPALSIKERGNIRGAIFFVSGLFFTGCLFGYYIVAPMSIQFLANYKLDPSIQNLFDITSYISLLCMMVLGCGIMFQLPVVVYVLSKIGMLGPAFMRRYRRHAIVIILIVAAILTPSPDILSQMLVGIPMVLLYEISIFISARIEKERKLKLEKL